MDKLVIDIETSNSFADVGGQSKLLDLKISLIGAYSYNKNAYFSFDEDHIHEFEPLLKNAGLVIGFAINRFDIPILNKHYGFDLLALERLDMLEEIELALGQRISLNNLAKANIGLEKTHSNGLEAIKLYNEGRLDELKEYCLNDVKLTKELYDLALKQGYLLVPEKNNPENLLKAEFDWKQVALPATLF